ncbi:hypothetical protein L3Q82_022959, partial [Scortum barcoo]
MQVSGGQFQDLTPQIGKGAPQEKRRGEESERGSEWEQGRGALIGKLGKRREEKEKVDSGTLKEEAPATAAPSRGAAFHLDKSGRRRGNQGQALTNEMVAFWPELQTFHNNLLSTSSSRLPHIRHSSPLHSS